MMMRSTLAILALLAASVPVRAETMPMNNAAHAGSSPADKASAAVMAKMMKDMHVMPTGNPDKDFVLMMLPHHQGAIDMAKVELQYGKDPELVALAHQIVEAQTKEIAEMNAWLAKNGK